MSAFGPPAAGAEWWHFSLSLGLVLVVGLCTTLAFWYTVLTSVGAVPESSFGPVSRVVRLAWPAGAPAATSSIADFPPFALAL